MNQKTKRLLYWGTILTVAAVIFIYMKWFNGNIIYISTGLNKETVLKVDELKATDMEAEILFTDAKKQYEEFFGADVWDKKIDGMEFENYVKDQLKSKLIRMKCMNVLAKERGTVLGRTETDNVTHAVTDYMSGLTQDQIQAMDITEQALSEMFTQFAIANKLFDDMTSQVNTEISADEARVIVIQYICADSEDKIKDAKAKLDNGESFFYVAREYNSDGEYEYELKRGEMEKAFEEAAFNLKTGETSSIVNAGDKYYIIKCTSDNEKTKTEANKKTMIDNMKLDEFNAAFETYESGLYVEFNHKLWDKMSVSGAGSLSVSFEDVFNKYFKN